MVVLAAGNSGDWPEGAGLDGAGRSAWLLMASPEKSAAIVQKAAETFQLAAADY
jgi:hypothetical protein